MLFNRVNGKFQFIMIFLAVVSLSFGRVGDILQVIDTPGPCPKGLAFDGENLWLSDSFTDRIYAINAKTGEVVKSFDSPGHDPEGLAWDGKHLWHIDSGENLVYQLDIKSGEAIKVIESSTTDPRDIAWDGSFLWISDYKKNVLIKVLPTDGMAANFFKAPDNETTGLAYDGKFLWVADRSEDRIYLVDTQNGLCLSSLRSYGPAPYGLAWADGVLWNVDYENRQIYRIKVFDENILTRWKERDTQLHFIKEFRNDGPGTIKTLDIYLPLPADRDNQKLLAQIEFDSKPHEIITDKWGQKIAHFAYKDLTGPSSVRPGWKVNAKVCAA